MKRVVILTGSELRHKFFRNTLAASSQVNILSSYCESHETNLRRQVEASQENNELRLRHLKARAESEALYFQESVSTGIDNSKELKNLNKGSISLFTIKNIKIENNLLIHELEIKNRLKNLNKENIFLINKNDLEDPLKNIDFFKKIKVKKNILTQ